MESELSIDSANDPHNDPQSPKESDESTAFKWQASDATFLRPNLAVPRIQRAWDRKPLSPFSRQRLRVGKVWKRSAPSSTTVATGSSDARSTKRRKARRSSSSMLGGLKPVKKLCMDSNFGMGARVLAWEGVAPESPVRKIVTRSTASNAEIVALPEYEEEISERDQEDEMGDVTIEVLDEDGTVIDVDPENAEQDEDWEDEVFDDTMMHLADIASSSQKTFPNVANESVAHASPNSSAESEAETGNGSKEDENQDQTSFAPEQVQPVLRRPTETFPLPDGFISPAKRLRPAERRRAMHSFSGSRRRTLPVQFAPSVLTEAPALVPDAREQADGEETGSIADEAEVSTVQSETVDQLDEEWEEVEDAIPEAEDVESSEDILEAAEVDGHSEMVPDLLDKSALEEMVEDEEPQRTPLHIRSSPLRNRISHLSPATRLPSSPVPSIEGPHPRLPLRRSPRRKSSSPLKQSTILPSTERPHLVAFTPIKLPAAYSSPSWHPDLSAPIRELRDDSPTPTSPLERAASAPPEEPQMSPQKPARPRVSDDTALLQAFLNRAAESKNSRRISASKRESIENRRDSDTVRQALASPQVTSSGTGVLVDLDPNSPSPRKPPASTMTDTDTLDAVPTRNERPDDEFIDDDLAAHLRTRRSNRAASKRAQSQPSTPAAPNKISIRGNTEAIFLKRTEAQETALLTRNNTRKNKGGAVLPPLRLTKMAASQLVNQSEFEVGGAEDSNGGDDGSRGKTDFGGAKKRKRLTWAETLVEFFQEPGVIEGSESSVLSDELNSTAASNLETVDGDIPSAVTVAAPPPPAETPSKPKIRQLKPPRTASTPGKAAVETTEIPAVPEQPKANTVKRRSRIATPAKGLSRASILPADLDLQPVPHSTTTKQAPATKKKAPSQLVSKLPAPAPTSSVSATLGQGKENTLSLISSPPKKKPATTQLGGGLPTAKSFAPKLEFGKAKLEPAPAPASEDFVPGLASPAKKGGRFKNMSFAAKGEDAEGAPRFEMSVPGLSSPAKKRTKRVGLQGE